MNDHIINLLSKAFLEATHIVKRDFNEIGFITQDKEKFFQITQTKIVNVLFSQLETANVGCGFVIVNADGQAKKIKNSASGLYVQIKPIDGEQNFKYNFPFFGTIMNVLENDKIIACAFYDYLRDEMFSAKSGLGAFFNGRKIRVKVSSNDDICLGDALECNRNLGSHAIHFGYLCINRANCVYAKTVDMAVFNFGLLISKEAGAYVKHDAQKNLMAAKMESIILNKF